MTTKANSITELWTTFDKTVLSGMSDLQRNEMRKAFYAGAFGTLVMQFELAEKDIPEDVAALFLEGWHEECINFFDAQAGRQRAPSQKDIDRPT